MFNQLDFLRGVLLENMIELSSLEGDWNKSGLSIFLAFLFE